MGCAQSSDENDLVGTHHTRGGKRRPGNKRRGKREGKEHVPRANPVPAQSPASGPASSSAPPAVVEVPALFTTAGSTRSRHNPNGASDRSDAGNNDTPACTHDSASGSVSDDHGDADENPRRTQPAPNVTATVPTPTLHSSASEPARNLSLVSATGDVVLAQGPHASSSPHQTGVTVTAGRPPRRDSASRTLSAHAVDSLGSSHGRSLSALRHASRRAQHATYGSQRTQSTPDTLTATDATATSRSVAPGLFATGALNARGNPLSPQAHVVFDASTTASSRPMPHVARWLDEVADALGESGEELDRALPPAATTATASADGDESEHRQQHVAKPPHSNNLPPASPPLQWQMARAAGMGSNGSTPPYGLRPYV